MRCRATCPNLAARDAREKADRHIGIRDRERRSSAVSAALLAGYLGWTLDAFDFFLVVSCLTAIGTEFHKSDAEMALTLTATLAFRPAGAFFFGLLADRYGRLPLIIVMIFYSLMEMLSGLASNHTTFLVLRALFGRNGRRVGRGRVAGHGKGPGAAAGGTGGDSTPAARA